jgi:hypothetical protein
MREQIMSWAKRFRLAIVIVLLSAAVVGAAYTTITGVAMVNSTVDSTIIGSTVPAAGTFTALTDSALSSGCVGSASGVLSNGNCLSQINFSFHNQYLALNQSIGANAPTFVDGYTVPAFPTGCGTNGCRIKVQYAYVIFGGTGSGVCYATDGTNLWALSTANDTNNNSTSCAGSGTSQTQYSYGTTPPTISIYTANPGTTTVCTSADVSPCTSGLNAYLPSTLKSYMQVEVVASN